MLPSNLGFSPIDGELAALQFACKAANYFLVNCQSLRLLSDCSGLVQMMGKELIKIKNPKHNRILTSVQHIVFKEVVHIPGSINALADCLSRLTTHVRMEGEEMRVEKPRILGLSSCRSRLAKQLDSEDPLVQNLASVASLDEDYLEMMRLIENRVHPKQIPESCELKKVEGALSEMRVVTMANGDRIIAKDSAVFIPVSQRQHMVDTLHLTHASGDSMLANAKDRVWWPGIRQALHQRYDTCKDCALFRVSQQRPANEVSFRDLFDNYFPNTLLQADFAEFQNQDYLILVCVQSGFGKVFKTKNKTTSEAVKAVRAWVGMYGRPQRLRVDAGPAFRECFIEELKKMGIAVSHTSAYSPQSNSHAERFVRTLKNLLRKCGGGMSQLELDEFILASNAQVQKAGQASSLDRFFG